VAAEPAPLGLLEGLATTRAIRRIRPDPIPDADLASILWHATRAPSGSNRQPARFLVLRDGPRAREAKALLGRSFRAGWDAKIRADGYDRGSAADPASPKARQAAAMQRFVDRFEEIPVVVLPCLVPYRSVDVSIGASVYPACQNLLLAARALGYGGVLTMWHRAVEDELRALLGIPAEVILAGCIPLGRPGAATDRCAAAPWATSCSTTVGASRRRGSPTRPAPASPAAHPADPCDWCAPASANASPGAHQSPQRRSLRRRWRRPGSSPTTGRGACTAIPTSAMRRSTASSVSAQSRTRGSGTSVLYGASKTKTWLPWSRSASTLWGASST
jgi:nitroreductase